MPPAFRKSCKGCVYLRPVGTSPSSQKICHYSLDTGEARGCPAESCGKYKPRKGAARQGLSELPIQKRAPPESELARLAREAMAAGMTYGKYVAQMSHGEPTKNTGSRQPKRRGKHDKPGKKTDSPAIPADGQTLRNAARGEGTLEGDG